MTSGLEQLRGHELVAELEGLLFPRIASQLEVRAPGHCMRISDLDVDLMARLCRRLRAELPTAEVVILNGTRHEDADHGVWVSSTKLVELRNPLPDGTQRRPLLVFIPANLRASAEDSFGVATFEELWLGDVYGDLRTRLLTELPSPLRDALGEGLRRLDTDERPWPFASSEAQVRFLLTAKINGYDPQAIGAALFELGLVPDLDLLARPQDTPSRIERNRSCVADLTWSAKSERGRVLELGLDSSEQRRALAEFVADVGLDDPRIWTRQIILDRANWVLTFDKWSFVDEHRTPDAIHIADVELDLPRVNEDEQQEQLEQLVGQQVLALGKGSRKLNVSFRVDPAPKDVRGLDKFVVQIVSKDHGPIGLSRFKSAWKGARQQTSVSFTKLTKVDWDEGWYYVRVWPQTAEGDRLNLLDDRGRLLPWSTDAAEDEARPRTNESDLFYVLPDGEVELERPQRSRQRVASLMHARCQLRFSALLDEREPEDIEATAVEWTERKTRGPGSDSTLEIKFGREGTVVVPLSRPLREFEQRVLCAPAGPLHWRLVIASDAAELLTADSTPWPTGELCDRFLQARTRYFEALRDGDRMMVTQGVDLGRLRVEIVEYADAYRELLSDLARRAAVNDVDTSQRALTELRSLLAIDSLIVTLEEPRGRSREAVVVGPTHPLRALWFATWAELSDRWVRASRAVAREVLGATRDGLLETLAPMNFPAVLGLPGGRLFTAMDNLGPFWTLYASPHEPDPRGLIGEICGCLGLSEPGIGGALVDGKYLAARVRRYLVQHPYVRTLVINAFNVGRARALADMLVALQRQQPFSKIRYDIRLFVHDPEAPAVGEALVDLLAPNVGTTIGQAADVFSVPTETHLRPKLALAIRHVRQFRADPSSYPAHISLLFDLFPAQEVGVSAGKGPDSNLAVHGLVRGFDIEYFEDETHVRWTRSPRRGTAMPMQEAEDLSELLAVLPDIMVEATALTATGLPGVPMRPVITLSLDLEDRTLLHQVHEASDWVFTIDRNMGVEFYDHGGHNLRPEYLLDHSPDRVSALGHRLVITTRSVTEIEAMVDPVLRRYGLDGGGKQALAMLAHLRSMSGRLALKLLSASAQRTEALGLALARMYLQHQGVLCNQILVPLDAHLELYSARSKSVDEVGDEVGFKRTDLALFDLDANARIITCRLVEVKCYSQVGDLREYENLKESVIQQINESQDTLSFHYDPRRHTNDRPDRLLQSQEFVALLDFYLSRAMRYNLVEEAVSEEARALLRSLEFGYELRFTRSALIFDLERDGTEIPEHYGTVEFHRIGFDLIRELMTAVCEAQTAVPDTATESTLSVPKLSTAAFVAPPRDRSVSTGELSDDDGQQRYRNPKPVRAREEHATPSVDRIDMPVGSRAESGVERTEPRLSVERSQTDKDELGYDVMLGDATSPQYGILGEANGRKVALDLNDTHTISLFGVQGGGKSYTLGSIIEMASLQIPGINQLSQPLATVIFHHSSTMDYTPEFVSMVMPNDEPQQLRTLAERYGAAPQALRDVVLVVPKDKLEQRRQDFPNIEVMPLEFSATELSASHWRFLMGAVGNQANYIRQINRAIKSLGDNKTISALRDAVDATRLSAHLKELAHMRIDSAEDYVGGGPGVGHLIRPGRLVIVDLRDEFIEKDLALGLFVVLLQLFSEAEIEDVPFNKLVVFDEAHKYIESPDLIAGLVEVVSLMRHKGTSIMIASQDPSSVPLQLIELSSQIILHKFNSPGWLKHIQKANASLRGLTPEKMTHLRPGEAFVWSGKASDESFSRGAIKIRCRPRATKHGGATKSAIKS